MKELGILQHPCYECTICLLHGCVGRLVMLRMSHDVHINTVAFDTHLPVHLKNLSETTPQIWTQGIPKRAHYVIMYAKTCMMHKMLVCLFAIYIVEGDEVSYASYQDLDVSRPPAHSLCNVTMRNSF